MKSSFILHIDSLCILDKLTDEQAGQFIKAIYHYQKTKEVPETDALIALVLTPFLNQFLRDEIKYETAAQRSRENGANGGRPPKNQRDKPRKPSGFKITQHNPENPEEPRKPDSDSVSDSVSENDKIIPFEVFWNTYNYKKDRADTVKAWNKLSQKDQRAAYHHIKTYESSLKEWQSKRYPATYLNKRTWEDEATPAESVPKLSVLKAVELRDNDQVVYENGKVYGAPNWQDVEEVRAGRKPLSALDRKVS